MNLAGQARPEGAEAGAIEAVGESLCANPSTPLVPSDLGGVLGFAAVRPIRQRRFDIAVLLASAIATAALLL